jgi:hypothetical protein
MVSFSYNRPVGRRLKTMPTEIVAETCPAPECNLTPRAVKQFVKELKIYHAQFKAAFRRPEQFKRAAVYLKDLLSDTPRKTIEPIALALGETVRTLQHKRGATLISVDRLTASITTDSILPTESVVVPQLRHLFWPFASI